MRIFVFSLIIIGSVPSLAHSDARVVQISNRIQILLEEALANPTLDNPDFSLIKRHIEGTYRTLKGHHFHIPVKPGRKDCDGEMYPADAFVDYDRKIVICNQYLGFMELEKVPENEAP